MSKTPLRIVLFSAAAIAGVAVLVWGFKQNRENDKSEEAPISRPPRVAVDAAGETVVALSPDAQARVGLRAAPLAAHSASAEIVAYGSLLEDPARSFSVRAPVTGTIGAAPGSTWPALGETVGSNRAIGQIEPRLAPVDRVNLRDRLVSAQAEVKALSASLAASKAAYGRLRKLNAEDRSASDKAVQEAEARLMSDEARLSAAQQSVGLIRSSLDLSDETASQAIPMNAAPGGQVVEVLAQPGEAVESGQTVLRLCRFDRLLAKVDLPPGRPTVLPAPRARIVVIGREDRPIQASAVALGAAVDPKTQGQSVLFQVPNPGLKLRPGMAVTAYLEQPGPAVAGVVLPRSAIVRHAGSAWVYLHSAPDRFTRHEVALDHPVEGGWFTTSLHGGDRLVVVGAQVLLSEELKSQIQVGEATEAQ